MGWIQAYLKYLQYLFTTQKDLHANKQLFTSPSSLSVEVKTITLNRIVMKAERRVDVFFAKSPDQM